ncbi:MAG: FAD-dependent oxidoreductase, partial [Desulfobacteraceae bacterium]|nr:FAD-dependent oxidoreductase [Desulfobacteraceae bacterium]
MPQAKSLPNDAVLVVGAGIVGMQAALDLAAMNHPVTLIDRSPSIGGNMILLDKTFPTNDCSTCMISPRMVACA